VSIMAEVARISAAEAFDFGPVVGRPPRKPDMAEEQPRHSAGTACQPVLHCVT